MTDLNATTGSPWTESDILAARQLLMDYGVQWDNYEATRRVLDALAPRVAELQRAAEARGRAQGRRSRHCGCAWCCATTPPEQRGATHKETCRS